MKILVGLLTGVIFLFVGRNVSAQTSVAVIIDHNSPALFESIPTTVVSQAAAKRVTIRRASVGGNIYDGLYDLYRQNSLYNFSNFAFQDRGNPGWQAKIDDFATAVAAQQSQKDYFGMKFCFIDWTTDVNQWPNYRNRMIQLESQYPGKKFIWWTMPLNTTASPTEIQWQNYFNNQVRTYVKANGKILFDIADIESYSQAMVHNVDSRGYEALLSDYTTDGGHLNTTGRLLVAKAFWVLMAKMEGWQSNSATPTPTPAKRTGDANGDGKVSGSDYIIWLRYYGTNVSGQAAQGDFNLDGRVNGSDYIIWLDTYSVS